jgi:hypothetical protein
MLTGVFSANVAMIGALTLGAARNLGALSAVVPLDAIAKTSLVLAAAP